MRKSTQVLVEALKKETQNERMKKILEKAEKDFYNDYFGVPTMPQHVLIDDLRKAYASDEIINRVLNGDFDGTKEESEEWANSPEGRAVFKSLLKGSNKRR